MGVRCKERPVGYTVILFIHFYPELIGSAITFHFEDISCDKTESIIVQVYSIQFDNRSKSDTLYSQSLNNYYNNPMRSNDETI